MRGTIKMVLKLILKLNVWLGKLLYLSSKEVRAVKSLISKLFNGECIYKTKSYEDYKK
jgi:hypothetical protein